MNDTDILDITEKVDILLKQSFGFPSTSENKQWYETITGKSMEEIVKENVSFRKK